MDASAEPAPVQAGTAAQEAARARSVFRYPEVIAALAVTLLMLALVPYAVSFDVYERIYTDGVYKAPHIEDPRYGERAGLMVFGLAAPLACVGCLAVSMLRRAGDRRRTIVLLTVVLCVLVLGWRNYPYWANGVHTATEEFVLRSGLDPKPLMPMIWLGDVWRLSVVLLYPLAVFGGSAIFVMTLIQHAQRGLKGVWSGVTYALLALTILAYLVTPSYLTWLMD